MRAEETLDAVLGELREVTDVGAPPSLESRLRARLRETRPRNGPRRRTVTGRVWLIAAVLAAGAVGLLLRPRTPPNTPSRATPRAAASSPAASPAAHVPAVRRVEARVVAASPPAPRRPARRPARRVPSTVEEGAFVALASAPALSEADSLHLVRVSVPGSALAAWGWPVFPGTQRHVQADVIVGHDGLARAIRFVAEDSGGGRH